MPARSQSRNLWPFAKKKRVVLSKEELKRIGDTQRRAMEADLQRARGGSSASSHRGSSAPSRTATHTPSSVSYKGYTIKPTEDGESWVIPKLDRDSHFDTLKDAKAFLTSWKKNPNVAEKVVKTTRKGGKSVLKFYDTLQGQVGRITGVPRAIVGKLVGGKNPGAFTITEVRYDRESNKTWAFVRTQQFSEWFSVSGHVAKSQLKGLLHHSVDKKLESFGVHPSDRLASNARKRFWVVTANGELLNTYATKKEAESYARNVGHASGIKATVKDSHKENPKNPQSGAEEMYESFHGKPAEGVTVVEEELHEHEWLAPLGVLVNYRVATLSGFDVLIGVDDETAAEQDFDETAANAETIFLSANEDGTQIYFKGGDQSLPLDRFKMGESTDWYRDDMIIGVLYEITYRTKKKFDKFKLTDYFHHLGEETGDQPMLRYDPLSPHQYVSGGKYKIKMPLIGMSPGIEN